MVAVIDNKTVITGSFNWSPLAAHTNDETLLIIESHQLAQNTSPVKWIASGVGQNSASPHGCSGHFRSDASSAAVGPRGSELAWELAWIRKVLGQHHKS